jgi:hypothetical protein
VVDSGLGLAVGPFGAEGKGRVGAHVEGGVLRDRGVGSREDRRGK